MDSPEKYNEVHDKWLRLTSKEVAEKVTPKTQAYLDLDTINLIQDALQVMVQTAEQVHPDGLAGADKRKVMQLGYSLEEMKHKLSRKIQRGERDAG